MARDLIKLAGKEPDSEIEIKYTRLRQGEKLYEELITVGEGIVDTHHEKIMVLSPPPFDPLIEIENRTCEPVGWLFFVNEEER